MAEENFAPLTSEDHGPVATGYFEWFNENGDWEAAFGEGYEFIRYGEEPNAGIVQRGGETIAIIVDEPENEVVYLAREFLGSYPGNRFTRAGILKLRCEAMGIPVEELLLKAFPEVEKEALQDTQDLIDALIRRMEIWCEARLNAARTRFGR